MGSKKPKSSETPQLSKAQIAQVERRFEKLTNAQDRASNRVSTLLGKQAKVIDKLEKRQERSVRSEQRLARKQNRLLSQDLKRQAKLNNNQELVRQGQQKTIDGFNRRLSQESTADLDKQTRGRQASTRQLLSTLIRTQ